MGKPEYIKDANQRDGDAPQVHENCTKEAKTKQKHLRQAHKTPSH